LLLAVGATLGCTVTDRRERAAELADRYFVTMRHGTIEQALELYAAEFYEATPRTVWESVLRDVRARLGTLETVELDNWKMEALPNGTVTTFRYRVRYSRDTANETLVVVEYPRDGSLRILGHHIVPDTVVLELRGEEEG
jgi:hypothetical protein